MRTQKQIAKEAEELAAAGVHLACLVVSYFGDGPIDELLDCDIRLRDKARAIIAAAGRRGASAKRVGCETFAGHKPCSFKL